MSTPKRLAFADWQAAMLFGLAASCIVFPIVTTTFIGDDTFNSYIDGWIAYHHSTLWGAIVGNIRDWDFSNGRFIPLLQVLNVVQFHLFHAPLPLKILQVAAIGVDVATLYATVRVFGAGAGRATLACSIALVTLQTRLFLDPISQFNLHFPLSTEAALLTLVFCVRYARFNKAPDLAFAISGFAIVTLLYETFIPLVFIVPLVLWDRSMTRLRKLYSFAPFAGIVAVEVAVVALVRRSTPVRAVEVYAPTWSGSYFHTFARQIAGTLPFSYIVDDPQTVFHRAGNWWLAGPHVCAIVAALSAALAVAGSRRGVETSQRSGMLAAGLTLLIAPALFISTSRHYQHIVRFGTPHTPVFIQGFGLALCVAAVHWPAALSWTMQRHRLIPAALLGFSVYTVAAANGTVVDGFGAFQYPRQTIGDGLLAGAGRELHDGDHMFLDHSYIVNTRIENSWENVAFYRLWAGRALTTSPNDDEDRDASSFERAFDLRSRRNTVDSGALLITRLASARRESPTVTEAMIYERHVAARPSEARPAWTLHDFATDDFRLVAAEPGATLYRFRPRCASLSPDILSDDAPTQAELLFGDGFFGEESDATERWRWGGSHASLTIRNPRAQSYVTRFVARIATAGAERGSVSIRVPSKNVALPLTGAGTPMLVEVRLPPRADVTLTFAAHAPDVAVPGDRRDLRFRLVDARLLDASGCAVEDEADSSRLGARPFRSSRRKGGQTHRQFAAWGPDSTERF